MPGPMPNPQSRRQTTGKTASQWVDLPPEGYTGEVPKWTGDGNPTIPEERIWARIWRTPQAAAWVRLGWQDVVVNYVRIAAIAQAGVDIKVFGELRQWGDRLGLDPAAMQRLHWRIASDEVAEARAAKPTGKPTRTLTIPKSG